MLPLSCVSWIHKFFLYSSWIAVSWHVTVFYFYFLQICWNRCICSWLLPFLLPFLKRPQSDIYILGLKLTQLSRDTYNDCDSTLNLNSLKMTSSQQDRVQGSGLQPLIPVTLQWLNKMQWPPFPTAPVLSEVNVGIIRCKCVSLYSWCKHWVTWRNRGWLWERSLEGQFWEKQNGPGVADGCSIKRQPHGKTWLAFVGNYVSCCVYIVRVYV